MTKSKSPEGLYIQLYNIHGLIRGSNLELGRDSDTGGQTKYVLELAKNLSSRKEVERVEIVTRWIKDKKVSDDYSKKEEKISDKLSIIRIRAGGGKYIRKELLWDHLEEFVDKSIKHIKNQKRLPDIIHSHYADAGFVCTELTKFFGIPLVHTGHSLGKSKLDNLLGSNMKYEEINKKYNIARRINAEENTIFYADRIITSTKQEIKKQYLEQYDNATKDIFVVIPPSIDLDKFHAFNEKREWDEESQELRNSMREKFWKFFMNMHKPIIFTLCRPEKRKNISGLIEAYGEDKELQSKANLAIFAGIRKDIQEMPELEKEVLTEMLILMDKYDLYGKMAIPKRHDVEYEVPELYRLAAETHGVFVNSAFAEPFGLTLIEAAASGLPVVATDDGGPRDILGNLKNGILVDVSDSKNIAAALNKILKSDSLWNKYSSNGISSVYRYYSWDAHTETYTTVLKDLLEEKKNEPKTFIRTAKRLLHYKKLIICDIDNTVLGDDKSLKELKKLIENLDDKTGFGVATGRTLESAKAVLEENDFLLPDLIISSVGSEIYYKDEDEYTYSTGWDAHISQTWNRSKIVKILEKYDEWEYQEEETQRKFKASYYLKEDAEFNLEEVKEDLIKNKIKVNLIFSHDRFLDILPYRAGKGLAVRYLSYRWNIPYKNILVAGDSGNDEDMLRGELLGVVVGNYSKEMEKLKGMRKIFFAKEKYAAGVIEGIKYYNFLEG